MAEFDHLDRMLTTLLDAAQQARALGSTVGAVREQLEALVHGLEPSTAADARRRLDTLPDSERVLAETARLLQRQADTFRRDMDIFKASRLAGEAEDALANHRSEAESGTSGSTGK